MSRARRTWITALVAVSAVVGGVLAISTSSAGTQAAWTDRVSAQAVITAGTWNTPAANSCTAVNPGGQSVSCRITAVYYDVTWGNAGDQNRNYYIIFNAPGAKTITFSVDLSSATGAGGTWSWANAGAGSASQFTGTGGWTCGSLPRVTGQAFDWYSTVYIPMYENKTGKAVKCS